MNLHSALCKQTVDKLFVRTILPLVLIAVTVSACTPSQQSNRSLATSTGASRPTATRANTTTPSLIFTRTRHPTYTRWPTATRSTCILPAPSPSSDPALAPFGCEYAMRISPDGDWKMCANGFDLFFASENGSKWDFSYEDYFGRYVDRTGYVYWSQYGQYVYFAGEGEHDAPRPIPYNARFLLMMDLQTGEVQTILPPYSSRYPSYWDYYAVSISPTGRRLAYNACDLTPLTMIIRDLKTGEEESIPLSPLYDQAGWYSWSEDGTELTFQVHDSGSDQYYLFTYNVLTLEFLGSQHLDEPRWQR